MEDVQNLFVLQERGAPSSPTRTAGGALGTYHSISSSTPPCILILMGFPSASWNAKEDVMFFQVLTSHLQNLMEMHKKLKAP